MQATARQEKRPQTIQIATPSSEGVRWLRCTWGLARAGWLRPVHWASLSSSFRRLGRSHAAALAASAQRRPNAVGLIDDRGSVTFAEIFEHVEAIAAGLAARGVRAGTKIGLFCRNEREFVYAFAAAQMVRARMVYLNTGTAGPQLAGVAEREDIELLIHDEDLSDAAAHVAQRVPRLLAWHEGTAGLDTLESIERPGVRVLPPRAGLETVILTSGTTGEPRGALRKASKLRDMLEMIERYPVPFDGTTLIGPPLFHTWGHGQMGLCTFTSATMVLQRRFDAKQTLAAIARWRPNLFVTMPTMLRRILELGPDEHRQHDTSSLRVVSSSGSALPGELATRWMNAFGDNLYNFYGSTELGLIAIAGPLELRANPQTAGRIAPGASVRIADEHGRPLPLGTSGRILVNASSAYAGYTDGSARPVIDDMIVTGDLGHLDERGWLFVDGREDDLVISGGEKVFPGEVENLLAQHPSVLDVAVVSVPDSEFGQRLKAFIVPRPGHDPTEEQLQSYVRDRLARYKVPREIARMSAIPRNPTGKVVRSALRG